MARCVGDATSVEGSAVRYPDLVVARRGCSIIAVIALAAVALGGCGGEPAAKCEPAVHRHRTLLPDTIDVLLVIDDSATMGEEQAALAAEVPRIVRALATGDIDGDGAPEFWPADGVRLGVVSTDMGSGGFTAPGCDAPDFGDDGILQTSPACEEAYPSFLEWRGADIDAIAPDAGCLAALGTGGCTIRQPLEAALKALAPARSGISFAMGTTGHGDGANWDFAQGGARLAIILLTNADDCSAADPSLFDPASTFYESEPTLRCVAHPEALHAVQRYVDGAMAIRHIELTFFEAIVGVPPDLVADPAAIDYEAVLSDPRMQITLEPSDPAGIAPSCEAAGRGAAYPPRRIVQLARDLEAGFGNALVQSICEPAGLGGAVTAILEHIGLYLEAACIAPLTRDEAGLVACDVIERSAGCAELPGRREIGEDECVVQQLPVVDGAVAPGTGWYLDDYSAISRRGCTGNGHLAWTRDARPASTWGMVLSCAPSAWQHTLSVGSPCPAPSTGCVQGERHGDRLCEADLVCDARTGTLQPGPCVTHEDCPLDFLCTAGECAPDQCRVQP